MKRQPHRHAGIDIEVETGVDNNNGVTPRRLGRGGVWHLPRLAWAIFAISLLLTFLAWKISERYIQGRAADRFNFRVVEVLDLVSSRLAQYELVLNGGIGFYQGSEVVTRDEWRSYVDNLRLQENYPGIQGVGVSLFVPPEEKTAFEQSVRDEGFDDFSIRPVGDRQLYSSIIFLEPFDWRNQRAFGYDMYSDPTRREAMQRSIRTGLPSVSGMVRLVQETDQAPQKGFLVYLPLYKKNMPLATTAQRWAAADGFVYAPFRIADLMAGILQSNGPAGAPDVRFEIYDSPQVEASRKMYDSRSMSAADRNKRDVDFTAVTDLDLNGRTWCLRFESEPGFVSTGESWPSLLVACGGLLIDLLLLLVIGSIGRQQHTAVNLASRMTAAFERTEQQFKAVCDTSYDPIIVVDQTWKILYANAAAEKAFQCHGDQFRGRSLAEWFNRDSPDFLEASDDSALIGKSAVDKEFVCQRNDGSTFAASVSRSTWSDQGGRYMAVVIRDITERKASERLIEQKIQELQRSNRDLDDFAYIASHDLRSPLRGIESLAKWVIEDASDQLPDESRQHLVTLIDRIEFMQTLLNNLLAYSRIGRVSERVRHVDTQALVERIAAMLSKPQNAVVRAKDLPVFETLPTPLETCLRNLIDNAIKHACRDDVVVNVTSHRDEQNVYFVVADNGPGIPERSLDRIFKIFQTLQPKVDSKSGTGIGLSIIKKTIETYGGAISVQSQIGEGSAFTLRVPIDIQMAPARDPVIADDA